MRTSIKINTRTNNAAFDTSIDPNLQVILRKHDDMLDEVLRETFKQTKELAKTIERHQLQHTIDALDAYDRFIHGTLVHDIINDNTDEGKE